MKEFDIRQASTGEEIAAARELFVEYQRWTGVDLCFQGFSEELAGLPGDYVPPSGRLLLASRDGEIAGCVALHDVGEGRAEMKRLYVRPAFQGSGLGRTLVERLLADARAIGYREVVLDTLPIMATAQALYERLGFRDVEPYRPNPVPGARYMGLRLDAGGLGTGDASA